MHFEVLVEDTSGEILMRALLPKVLGANGSPHTWRTHAYKGIGRIPPGLRGTTDAAKRILLDRLPKLLAGYGKSLMGQDASVVVIVDLDHRDCLKFKQELLHVVKGLRPRPTVLFRIAIEETEAWLLGDRGAVLRAFPKANNAVLESYVPDSICGTWEKLADAVFPGGAAKLKAEGYPRIGEQKCRWAQHIGQHIEIESHPSPSLRILANGLLRLAEG